MEVDEIRVAKVANVLHQGIQEQIELNATSESINLNALLNNINQFQPCPQLLDKHLKQYVNVMLDLYIKNGKKWITEVFYTFGKIVSSKKMLNFMKTDIELIPTILSKIDQSQDIDWHEKYLLLCWLSVLCLAPFKLDSLRKDAKQRIFTIGVQYLKTSGPLQPLGARLLASLIMRSDCAAEFDKFMELLMEEYMDASEVAQQGYLETLNIALQKDSNMIFQPRLEQILSFTKSVEKSECHVDLVSKIYSKLVKYLIDMDDYDQIEEIITYFLNNFHNRSTDTRFLLAKKFVKLVSSLDSCFGVEIIIDIIHSTKELLLESFETINSDKLHTHLLTLAEFLRLSLVDKAGYKDIVEILDKTLFFQQSRITFIAGSNIRDASNFISWSLFKYNKDIDVSTAFSVFKKLLLVTCFDKEIMVRRSSTAALQELIGRYGNKIWEEIYPSEENSAKNIRLIEILDYIDLGSIEKSYFDIPSKVISLFPGLDQNFISFLSQNVYNLDYDVVKLSSRALKDLLSDQPQDVVQSILSSHFDKSSQKFNAFIVLSEILPLSQNKQYPQLKSTFQEIKLNHHKDSVSMITSYLSLLNTLLEIGYELDDWLLENLFDAIRVDNEEIKEVLIKIVSKITLSGKDWDKWIYYVRNNNLNTSSSVGYFPDFGSKVGDVVHLLSVDRVDADTKASIISSISIYLYHNQLDKEILGKLVEQLDDYTISEQGDVGNKIRSQTIKLIEHNINVFKDSSLSELVIPKLLRLSCEPIDKTRSDSFHLLMKFYGIPGHTFHSLDGYFTELLNIYKKLFMGDKETSKEFWKGFIFTAGAIKSTDSLIIASLKCFLRFYETLSSEAQKEILLQLASVIKIEPQALKGQNSKAQRLNKTILVGLQFWSRILDSNLLIPKEFPVKGLYVRIYNLHLNTKNINRLTSSIKIFGYLAHIPGLKEPLERLCWLCSKHPIARVRVLASEELFNIYNEKMVHANANREKYIQVIKLLSETDWNLSGNSKYEKELIISLE